MVPENAEYIGDVHILDIGLRKEFYDTLTSEFEITDGDIIHSIYKRRNRFAHKGNFGHAIIIAGSYGKIGAAVLAVQSCLRSGVGLLTAHIPKCGYDIMQSTVPEAMVSTDFNSSFITKLDTDIFKFDSVGIGPGIGTASETKSFIKEIFHASKKPIVIDADALNIIATQKELMNSIPAGSILTPHPKEFERLFGASDNDFDRIRLAQQKAKELGVVIVLKGHHTFITSPNSKKFFNSTGNAGMATGGSGDVLTGILTGLVAQNYLPADAAILGVYLHGLAGDIAANKNSMEAMIASDIIDDLKSAFQMIRDF